MAEYYDKPITMDTDWGGDATTRRKRVKGNRIQELLKKELLASIGFVRDVPGARQYFRSEDDAKKYDKTHDEKYLIQELDTSDQYRVRFMSEEAVEELSASDAEEFILYIGLEDYAGTWVWGDMWPIVFD